MSCDSSQSKKKFEQIGSNVFQIGMRVDSPPRKSSFSSSSISSVVLKAENVHFRKKLELPSSPQAEQYKAPNLTPKKDQFLSSSAFDQDEVLNLEPSRIALETMQKNLEALKNLQGHFRFILKELEDLIRKDSQLAD